MTIADPRANNLPLVEPEHFPGERQFVGVALVACLLILAGVATVNYLVDPYGAFSTGLLPPVTWQDRDEKAVLFTESDAPDVLIVGSSRVMKLDPLLVERATGMRAFNFGVNSARAEDYFAVLRFALDHDASPRRVLLGIDPEALHPRLRFDARSQSSRMLEPYLPPPDDRIQLAVEGMLGWDEFRASLSSLKRGRADRPRTSSFRADGLLRYVVWDSLVERGAFRREQPTRAALQAYRRRYAGFDRLSQNRVEYLTAFLDSARRRGIRVDAFIPPLDPAFVDSLRSTTFDQRRAETWELLGALERRGLLRRHDLFDPASFGADPAGFYDGTHMMPETANRLLTVLLGRGRDAVQ